MNSDMNVNTLIRRMKETRIPESDVTGKVMQKVYSYHSKHRIHRQQRFRISPVWIAACAVLFIATASVSAATLFKTSWNGIQVDISDHVKDASIPADKNEPAFKKKLETALSKSEDVWRTISLDEAAKQFPFPLLRPQDSKFTLVESYGVAPQDENYRVKSAEEWWLGGFYDIFQWNQRDIVVIQDVDAAMTESLQDPNQTMSMTFQNAPWENVEVTDDVLAMFLANDSENFLLLKYKTADRKVISLEITGDLSKDDLVELARTYVGK